MPGIIMGALGGLGEGMSSLADTMVKNDLETQQKLAVNRQDNDMALQRAKALEDYKLAAANAERQRRADDINAGTQPILDQGIVGKAASARAQQLPEYSGDADSPTQFHGDAQQVLAAIQAMPDGPDKQAALAQLKSNVASNKPSLTMADLTDDEKARFAPTAADRDAAYIEAAKKKGYIDPKDVLSNSTRAEVAEAQANSRIAVQEARNEALNARTQAQYETAMVKVNAALDKMKAGQEMTPEMETVAKGIADGKLAPLSGYALRTPGASLIMSRVMELNPDYDATQYGTRQKAEKDFATGKNGNTVRSFNVALSHLDTLSQLADALNNGNTQMINRLGNAISSQTGGPAPTNFETAKHLVADEVVKAVIGAGGALGDREAAQKVLDAANSPDQLKGAISTYQHLMAGQIEGMRHQYKATVGKDDFDDKYLSPEIRAMVAKFSSSPGGGAAAIHIGTDAEYNALPSGATFIAPDGTTRRKP
jgi:hypothetical protein